MQPSCCLEFWQRFIKHIENSAAASLTVLMSQFDNLFASRHVVASEDLLHHSSFLGSDHDALQIIGMNLTTSWLAAEGCDTSELCVREKLARGSLGSPRFDPMLQRMLVMSCRLPEQRATDSIKRREELIARRVIEDSLMQIRAS